MHYFERVRDEIRDLAVGLRDHPWAVPAVAGLAVVLVASVAWLVVRADDGVDVEAVLARAQPAPDLVSPTVLVHVSGEVGRPGVYELPVDSRIGDAVDAAGGALPSADLDRLNLAAPLNDGARVQVPRPGQDPVPIESGPEDPAAGPVNLNDADAAQLETLPGIGPALAEALMDHREEHGPFRTPEELLDVPGIGPAKLDALRDLVAVR